MEYLLVFSLSTLFAHLATKVKNLKFFCSFLAILLPAILGGIRSSRVGTDNFFYFEPMFHFAHSCESFAHFWKFYLDNDFLSVWLFYVISRFTNDYHWFCFITTAISVTLIYVAIFRNRKYIDVWIALLAYFLILYCPLLCYVRQSLAIGVCAFSIYYAEQRKYIKFTLLLIVAYLFHASALVFLLYLFVSYFINDRKILIDIRKVYKILFMVSIILLTGLFFLKNNLGSLEFKLARLKTLAQRYGERIAGASITTAIKWIISFLPPIFYAFSFKKKTLNTMMYAYIIMSIGLLFLLLFITISEPMKRLALFYALFMIMLIGGINNLKKGNVLIPILCVIYLLLYWFIFTVMNTYGFTLPVYPYMSDML